MAVFHSSPAVANGVVYVGSEGCSSDDGSALCAERQHRRQAVELCRLDYLEYPRPPLWMGCFTPCGDFRLDGPSTTIVPERNSTPFAAQRASADLFLRIRPTPTTVHQGDLITYAFPVWNLGPDNAVQEVLNTQVPEGTTFDYIRISGTPGLGTCTNPPYRGTGRQSSATKTAPWLRTPHGRCD